MLFTTKEIELVKNIKHLINKSITKYDRAQQAANMLLDLEAMLDNEGYTIDCTDIIPADEIKTERKAQLKDQLNTDNDYEPSTLQDLAFIDRNHDEKYFYINAYNRVQLVTITDIDAELSDLLDNIKTSTNE